jgi:hypothetical protein
VRRDDGSLACPIGTGSVGLDDVEHREARKIGA